MAAHGSRAPAREHRVPFPGVAPIAPPDVDSAFGQG
jgi:hypothetical protein